MNIAAGPFSVSRLVAASFDESPTPAASFSPANVIPVPKPMYRHCATLSTSAYTPPVGNCENLPPTPRHDL